MRRLAALVAGLVVAGPAVADPATALAAARARFPDTDVRSAAVTPLVGVYEYDMGGETVYGDVTARWLLLGRLVDMQRLVAATAPLDYDRLAADALELQAGTVGEVLLFSDPQCPYCAALERRLVAGELAGYRVRLVLAPVLPGSQALARDLLCLPDPAVAYRALMLDGARPPACTTPATHDRLGPHLAATAAAGVRGTPSLLAPNGQLHQGLPPPGELLPWVAAGQR